MSITTIMEGRGFRRHLGGTLGHNRKRFWDGAGDYLRVVSGWRRSYVSGRWPLDDSEMAQDESRGGPLGSEEGKDSSVTLSGRLRPGAAL
jgi:hypothetical protein